MTRRTLNESYSSFPKKKKTENAFKYILILRDICDNYLPIPIKMYVLLLVQNLGVLLVVL